jgi:nucleoside-diphosphate-sugar epimerase
MKLFVTGGTGFIGSHFINYAHKAGYDIIALKRPNSIPRVELDKEPTWVEGQLDGEFGNQLNGCDILVHLAAHSPNPPYDSLETCLYWNLNASLKLFNQAHHAGISKFLVAGSCFEYGKSGDRYEYIPVDAPLEPTMAYPTSKAAASVAFSGWAIDKNINLQILRIFQVFGEGEPLSRLWPSLKKAAISGDDYPMTMGEQIRDFIPVEDVADEFVSSLLFDKVKSGLPMVKNIGTGKPITVCEFSKYWWNKLEAKGKLQVGVIPYRKNEIMRFVPMIENNI